MLAGEVDLNTWYKPHIDKKTLKELSKRSDLKGLVDISLYLLALFLSAGTTSLSSFKSAII